jgi:hypothetical protein
VGQLGPIPWSWNRPSMARSLTLKGSNSRKWIMPLCVICLSWVSLYAGRSLKGRLGTIF